MIYIITEENDVTTNKVVEYLIGFGHKFIRLNTKSLVDCTLSISDNLISIYLNNDKLVEGEDIIWIRRGRLFFLKKQNFDNFNLFNYLKIEEDALNKSIEIICHESNLLIGTYLHEKENYKISNLFIAKRIGLMIPNTLVTNSKVEALNFYKKHKNIISKDLRYPVNLKNKNESINSVGTIKIEYQDIIEMNDFFFQYFFKKK